MNQDNFQSLRFKSFDLNYDSSQLPIQKRSKTALQDRKHFCTVVVGQTGSGKSTKIPQLLIEAGYCAQGKQIALTLPRRVAVLAIADRIAFNTNTLLGEEIGYAI